MGVVLDAVALVSRGISSPYQRSEDTALVAGDQAVDDVAIGLERGKRRLLVLGHEVTVSDHVGGEGGGKPALDALHCDEAVPSQMRLRKTLHLWVG